MKKVIFTGTHRVRSAEDTMAILSPLLADYGITRLADVTGLDDLGVPVVMAVRPLAATLAVAQGKGVTLMLAKVSAAMEAIELWHAEQAVPAPRVTGAPAAALRLSYQVTDLAQPEGSLLTAHTVLDWIAARSAVDGSLALVPRDAVRLGAPARVLPGAPRATSNGLASGNSQAEALTHALCEVIERDATAALQAVPAPQRAYLDLDTVTGYCAGLISRIRGAGAWLEVAVAPARPGIWCFAAQLAREDLAVPAAGSGAHADAAVALARAITEAAQSRLTAICGTRDDIPARTYARPAAVPRAPGPRARVLDWAAITAGPGRSFATDDEEAQWLARSVAAAGADPLVVNLCEAPISVVKVLCPRFGHARHGGPRPARATV